MNGAKPWLRRHVLASAGMFCGIAVALLVGGLWWKSTWEAGKEVAARLDSARNRLSDLEALAADGRVLEGAWSALRELGVKGASRDEAFAEIREVLRAHGKRAGVRLARMNLRAAEAPAHGDIGCEIEIRTRVEGSSAAIVNWVYLLQASAEPMMWIDSVAWISEGDPSRMVCDAVMRTPFVSGEGGS